MPITKGYQQLVDEAMAEVTTYSVDEVRVEPVDRRSKVSRGTTFTPTTAPAGCAAFATPMARRSIKRIGESSLRAMLLRSVSTLQVRST